MTWLKTDAVAPIPTADQLPPDLPLTSTPQGLTAATSNMWRNADGSTLLAQEAENETKKLQSDIEKRLGTERVKALYLQKGFLNPDTTPFGTAPISSIVIDPLLEAARQDAEINPDAWKGVDLSREGIKARVDQRRLQEHQDEQAIIAMSPHPVAEQFLGGLAANMADPKQWALMAFNPGGSFLKAVGWQGVLGMVGAAANIPSEREVAPALGEEGPDVQHELLMGGLAGLGLEGLARGLGPAIRAAGKVPPLLRGLAYHAERTKPTPGDHIIDAAEAALQADKSVAEAVAPLIAEQPLAPPLPPREPLVLGFEQRVDNPIGQPRDPLSDPAPTALAPDPVTTAAVPSAVEALTSGDRVAGEAANLDAAIAADHKKAKPLMAWLKSGQPPSARQLAKAGREGRTLPGGEDLRIDPNGMLGRELKSQDITPKTAPGIWRKGGRDTLDNIVASEMEQAYPGIIDATKSSREPGAYLDRDGLMALLVRDAHGDKSWLQSHQEVMRASESLTQVERAAAGEVPPPEPVPETRTGFDVNPQVYEFAPNGMADLETDLNGYLDTQWPGVKLTASERQEFTSHMMTHGGNAEDVMVSILSRDQEFVRAEGPTNHADLNDPAFQAFLDEGVGPAIPRDSGGGPVRPHENASPAGNGASDAGNGFSVESTAIGDQYLVPGTERRAVANRDAALIALKQQQSKLRRPDQMRVEDDATGLFAAPNLDLFDDMASLQARAYIDQVAADMSMRADQGFGVDIPPGLTTDEGTQIHSVKGVLDEFAEMDRMEKEFADCMKMGVPDGV